MFDINLKRAIQTSINVSLLVCFISVLLSYVLPVFTHSPSTWYDLRLKIFLTSFVVLGAGIIALVCTNHIERNLRVILGWAGIAFAFIGVVLVLILIWDGIIHNTLVLSALTFVVLAATHAHICLLHSARLSPGYAWVQWLGMGNSYSLAVLYLLMEWRVILLWNFAIAWQLFVISVFLVPAFTVIVLVLHRINKVPSGSRGLFPKSEV